jgi:hypothetical protein
MSVPGWTTVLGLLRALLDEAERKGYWTSDEHDQAAHLARRLYADGLVHRWQSVLQATPAGEPSREEP